ncbi:MAG: hypothetical protein ACRDG3_01335 [Tepidiformaceae bacterium]
MNDGTCGAPTQKGTPCKLLRDECDYHRRWRERTRRQQPATPAPRSTASAQPNSGPVAASTPPPGLGERNLRDLGWWVVGRMTETELTAPNASVVVAVMRILASLGPEPLAEEDALKQVELRGLIMHGQPPRSAEEWQLAADIFEDDALEEFHRWDDEIERLIAGSRANGPPVARDHTEGLSLDAVGDAFDEPIGPL